MLAELRRLGQQQQRQVELKRPDATRLASVVFEVQRCLDLTDLLHGALTALDVKSWTGENVAGHKRAEETNDVA